MPADVFFDTTILVYMATRNDSRAIIAEELLRTGGIISVQVLNEFVAVARKKMWMNWGPIEELLLSFRDLCGDPIPISAEIHIAAVQIAKRSGYHIYDSLMIAAAQDAGCTTLYSEDMQQGQRIGSLRIQNPF